MADPEQPAARVAAARMMLDAATSPDPRDRRAAFSEIVDRLDGKAMQTARVINDTVPDLDRVLAEARAQLVGGDLNRNVPALPESTERDDAPSA